MHERAATRPAQFPCSTCRSLTPAISKIYMQTLRKALTIECLARKNDSTRASNLLIEKSARDQPLLPVLGVLNWLALRSPVPDEVSILIDTV